MKSPLTTNQVLRRNAHEQTSFRPDLCVSCGSRRWDVAACVGRRRQVGLPATSGDGHRKPSGGGRDDRLVRGLGLRRLWDTRRQARLCPGLAPGGAADGEQSAGVRDRLRIADTGDGVCSLLLRTRQPRSSLHRARPQRIQEGAAVGPKRAVGPLERDCNSGGPGGRVSPSLADGDKATLALLAAGSPRTCPRGGVPLHLRTGDLYRRDCEDRGQPLHRARSCHRVCRQHPPQDGSRISSRANHPCHSRPADAARTGGRHRGPAER